ncbi:MAG: hypothetical protein KAS66_16320 [Candidatus Omnitrophica bacterium]|nr:hypothetical protein [Candidatus Omnitrophota bacterium]
MKDKIAIMLNGKLMLPGTLAEYYNVCGKTPCRCKDKDNPQKHGPYFQLSYNLRDKNSSISVKKRDAELIRQMTDNYRIHVQNTQDLSLELLELYKNEGYQTMIDKYERLIEHEISKKTGARPESAVLRETKTSLEKWKNKSIERRIEIEKLKVKVRDLSASRDNWKSKAVQTGTAVKELQAEVLTLKKNS